MKIFAPYAVFYDFGYFWLNLHLKSFHFCNDFKVFVRGFLCSDFIFVVIIKQACGLYTLYIEKGGLKTV